MQPPDRASAGTAKTMAGKQHSITMTNGFFWESSVFGAV